MQTFQVPSHSVGGTVTLQSTEYVWREKTPGIVMYLTKINKMPDWAALGGSYAY